MNRLKDKRALITGGTSGIGLETARRFLAEGARVAITGTSPATFEAARQELGSDAVIVASDASDVAAQKSLAETIRGAFGGLDTLSEIAHAVVFLASDGPAFVVGSEIQIDGGTGNI